MFISSSSYSSSVEFLGLTNGKLHDKGTEIACYTYPTFQIVEIDRWWEKSN